MKLLNAVTVALSMAAGLAAADSRSKLDAKKLESRINEKR